jgi:hypothetical protein
LIQTPVHTFDPFAGAETLDLPLGQRGAFAGAMGLLFARAEGQLPINFASPRQPKPPQNFNYRLVRLAGVACVALLLGLVILGRVLHAAYSIDVEAVRQQRVKVEEELANTQLNQRRFKAIDDWDMLVVLDELYDLTARIPDVNSLRIKSISIDPSPRSSKTHYVAKATIKGELRLSPGQAVLNLREPLDKLIGEFSRDGNGSYYSPEPPKVESNVFTLVVNVARRAPEEYKVVLKDRGKGKAKANAAEEDETVDGDGGEEMNFPKAKTKGKTRGR